jgi:hypothetical protein
VLKKKIENISGKAFEKNYNRIVAYYYSDSLFALRCRQYESPTGCRPVFGSHGWRHAIGDVFRLTFLNIYLQRE